MARAAKKAKVQCYVWSTLPSALELSGGKMDVFIYNSKNRVDAYVSELELPAVFVLTATFFENFVTRNHVVYIADDDKIEFRHPVIRSDTKLYLFWVEKDLSSVVKAVYDNWMTKQAILKHQYLFASGTRLTYNEVVDVIERETGKPTQFVLQPTSGNAERDRLFQMYNELGTTYPGFQAPDPKVLDLGVKFSGVDEYVRERVMPFLGLSKPSDKSQRG